MTKSTKQILIEARALIEKGWCQKGNAKGKSGRYVNPRGKEAISWCALGAIEAVSEQWQWGKPRKALVEANNMMDGVAYWNDAPGRTQAEVLAAFDKAIAWVESRK